ncbi:MAG: hypothetical protein ACK5TH_02985 [Prosthecobacter sp.]|jgi:hypothetical protein
MKPSLLILMLGLASGVTASAQSYTDIDVSNQATIGAALNIGWIQPNTAATSPIQGLTIYVQQTNQEVMKSYTEPGHWQDNWVTMEEYGTIQYPGSMQPQFNWQIVGYDDYPAVVDANGDVVTEAYSVPRYDYVYTGDVWVDGGSGWGVVGTYEDNQEIWVDERVVSYTQTEFDAPVIHQAATRSDANWVWEVPHPNGGQHVFMRAWNGGLALNGPDGRLGVTLSPTSLSYNRWAYHTDYWGDQLDSQTDADGMTLKKIATNSAGGEIHRDEVEVRADLIRLTRNENYMHQTQIGPKSAAFGGMVSVKGELHVGSEVSVKGSVRVPETGDLLMGEFTQGSPP